MKSLDNKKIESSVKNNEKRNRGLDLAKKKLYKPAKVSATEGLTLSKFRKIMGEDATNWAGNQSNFGGNQQAIKGPKKNTPEGKPEDRVKLGGVTPLIINPTLSQTATKANEKDKNIIKRTIERPVTEDRTMKRAILFGAAWLARKKIGATIRGTLGSQSRASASVTIKQPKVTAKAMELQRQRETSAQTHSNIVNRGMERLRTYGPLKQPIASGSLAHMNAAEYAAHLKKNTQNNAGDKPAKPPKPEMKPSDLKTGQHISSFDFRKMLKANPNMKIKGVKAEENINEISSKKLYNYQIASAADHKKAKRKLRKVDWNDKKKREPILRRLEKRSKGLFRAAAKQSALRDPVKVPATEETIRKVIAEAIAKAKGKAGAKGQDTEGDTHPINLARKAVDLHFPVTLKHHNKEHSHITPEIGHHIITNYGKLRKPDEKEQMINQIWGSAKGLNDHLAGKKHEPKPVHWALKGITRT